MEVNEEEHLAHYGILRRSGRYPWGSGGNVPQRSRKFLDYVKMMELEGLTESQIAEGQGLTINDLRAMRSIASNRLKQYNINWAIRLRDKGLSTQAIADRVGAPESTIRSWLKPDAKRRSDALEATMEMLKKEVAEKELVDVGLGVENQLGISNTQLKTARAGLKMQGYREYKIQEPQPGTGKYTTVIVMAPPGTPYSYVFANRERVQQVLRYTQDYGENWSLTDPPLSISSSRLQIRYAEDGGAKADGVIYVRPGVKDVSLDKSNYAQVRILVDGTHYIKGMAVYKDDLPDGVDLLFNTNKERTDNKLDALKPVDFEKTTPDNPFGTYLKRQIKDEDGKVSSAMNIVREAGDWNKWSNSIASQVLSKQSPEVAREQLAVLYDRKKREYDEIMALTNPTVRKKLLEEFADGADAASIHLKAAALPRQRWQVILPVEKMSPREVYAPNFEDGETVVLIRYPHGGKFEIPELTVNNRQRDARRLLGTDLPDAIGIHPDVAARLSGADFDGDTVLVIPNRDRKIKTQPAIKDLEDFNPRATFKLPDDAPKWKDSVIQANMGLVSNLITDMTIKGATLPEITRAVKHSMVVIDAKKHGLDIKQSAQVHGIPALMETYAARKQGGASTLISKGGANSRQDVPKRRLARKSEGAGPKGIDPKTGQLMYVPTGEYYTNRKGERVYKTEKVPRLGLVDDANKLSSGTEIERAYADHSNKLKALANEARLEYLRTPRLERSPTATKVYAKEVASLNAHLQLALQNKPLERRAITIANAQIRAKKDANPDLDQAQLKKIESIALETARKRVGAQKQRIKPTQAEWDAIQAGALSDSKLAQILDNADMDHIRSLATPRVDVLMDSGNTARAKRMLSRGATMAEVAKQLGVSVSTVERSLR